MYYQIFTVVMFDEYSPRTLFKLRNYRNVPEIVSFSFTHAGKVKSVVTPVQDGVSLLMAVSDQRQAMAALTASTDAATPIE
jgi:hypothetical protein